MHKVVSRAAYCNGRRSLLRELRYSASSFYARMRSDEAVVMLGRAVEILMEGYVFLKCYRSGFHSRSCASLARLG
jgi:hypothetical protein